MTFFIDNGHSYDTPGKRSRNSLFREGSHTREIARTDLLSTVFYKAVRKHLAGQRIRRYNGPEEPDFEINFFVLHHSKCPAVLAENLYQDCRSYVTFLQGNIGKKAIIMLHVEGIIDYLSR